MTARFTAPDALTRYRLIAVASAGVSAFGSSESSVKIAKPLLLLPSSGQFANLGDTINARAVVQNQTGADGAVNVALTLSPGVETAGGPTSTQIMLRNGESRAVDFPVRFTATGQADWKWSAELGQFRDQVRVTFPIRSPMVELKETYLTDITGTSTNLFADVNPQLLEGQGTIDLAVSNTRLSGLRGAVSYLLDYPYSCAEQTSSILVPWVVEPSLRPLLPGVFGDSKQAAAALESKLAHLFSLQTDSGGVAFWSANDRPSLFASSWAVVVLSRLKDQKVKIPDGLDSLVEYLSGSLRSDEDDQPRPSLADRALTVYALSLAGHAEPAYHEDLYNHRADLTRESRALLALAILQAKGSKKMAAELLSSSRPAPDDDSIFGDPERQLAIRLLAWVSYDPSSKEVPRLVKELLDLRRNGRWSNTQDNAWALLALQKYFDRVEKGGQAVRSGRGVVRFNADEHPFSLTPKEPAANFLLALNPAPQPPSLTVSDPDKGTMFTEARFTIHPPLGEQPRQDRGFGVTRNYWKLRDDGSYGPPENLKVGDTVLVELRIEAAQPGAFVAVDDPLPSILEAVNPDFKSRASAASADATNDDWVCSHSEMHADRVLYFYDQFPAGARTIRYLARVRSAGDASAGATKVEEMYRPERFGLGELTRLSAQPAH